MINIGILTFPMAQANVKPFSNLVNIVKDLSDSVYVIATRGKNTNLEGVRNEIIYEIVHKSGKNPISRIFRYIWTQLKMSQCLANLSKKVDLWIFYIGDALVVPMITAKILRKKVVLVIGGFMEREIELRNDYIGKVLKPLKKINLSLSHCIVLYSPNFIKEWNFEKYRNKILIAHEHFLDFNKFEIKKKLRERNNLVGYIGRLSEEKGVLNFVKAIPEVLKERDDIEFLIGGDGQLRDEIEKYINEKNLNDKIKLAGWIPHGNLPDYLNELKLVVLPSFTEGLPNVMLEAMACGTPVLATPVGAIPDVITDGETGFIMENNSPECIARNVIRALNHPNLERIAENARALVEREFTYERAVERWREVVENV